MDMPMLFVCDMCDKGWGTAALVRKHLPKCRGHLNHPVDVHGPITVRWIKVTTTKYRNPQPYKVPVCVDCRAVIVTRHDNHPCYVYGGDRTIIGSLKVKARGVQRLQLLNETDEDSDFE